MSIKKYHVVGGPVMHQETGDDDKGTMSQKAVTEALDGKLDAPEVTEADNGKVFMVVDGVFEPADLPKEEKKEPVTITFTIDETGELSADKTIAECLEEYRKGARVEAIMVEGAVTYRGELVSVYTLEEDPQVVESVSFSLSAGAIKHIAITSSWDTNFGYFDYRRITLVTTDDKYNGEVIE